MSATSFPQASRIGFGCASLGSRISERKGLAALSYAFDAGINWFDLAPSYGDGGAETIFAQFARTRRDRIHICTKCGIEASPQGGLQRALKPLARRVIAALPALRGLVASGRAAPQHMPLTSKAIRSSLDRSLQRLATDHVDVYALHDPDPDTLDRDEIRRALEQVLSSGKARVVGIAGSVEAALVALRANLPVGHVQIADPPFAQVPSRVAAAAGPQARYFLATHSIYGKSDPFEVLLAKAGSRDRLCALLTAHGYTVPDEGAARAAVLDHALVTNPDGVVLLSMFSQAHVIGNLARVRNGTPRQAAALFRELGGERP